MKMKSLCVGILLVGCAAATACITTTRYQPYPSGPPVTQAPPPMAEVAPPPVGGSDEPFYDDLAPYGRWVYVAGPGWVWSPATVQAGWRPYQLGHWVFTDYGWTWASDEPYGWAVYHYGRWHQAAGYGWVWVPGSEWGPAWVAWNEGGGYVGWAPLPWQVTVRAGVGIDWSSVNVSIAPSSWCFVTTRYLVDPALRHRIESPERNVRLIRVSRNITNYTYIDNRIVNRGVRVETVSRAAGRKIPHYRVADAESADRMRGGKSRGDEFPVYRPDPRRGHGSRERDAHASGDERDRPWNHRTSPASSPRPDPPAPPPQSAPAPAAQPQPAPPGPDRSTQPRGRDSRHGRGLRSNQGRPVPEQNRSPAPPIAPAQSAAPAQPAAPARQAAPRQNAATAQKKRQVKTRGKGSKKDSSKTTKSKTDASETEKPDSRQ